VQIPDAQVDAEYSQSPQPSPSPSECCRVPMIREGRVIGAVAVGRIEVQPFTENEIALLQTFAHQAVHRHRKRSALQNRSRSAMPSYVKLLNIRPQPPRCSGSSVARQRTFSPCSMRS
jgi:signal transduction protein with GAF and PtsI domain